MSQQMVQNGGFEHAMCPSDYIPGQFDSVTYWTNLSPAYVSTQWPPYASPDYFNVCATLYLRVPSNFVGFQYPHAGNAYAGIVTYSNYSVPFKDYREYIENELKSTLIKDSCYLFEMYVCLGDSRYAVSDIQVYFSDTLVENNVDPWIPPFTPQLSFSGFTVDTVEWVRLSAYYTATGTENYLILGNFKDDLNTPKTVLNQGHPDRTGYFFIDDVSLTQCYEAQPVYPKPDPATIGLPNVFTPNNDGANNEYIIHHHRIKKLDVRILNRWGNAVAGYDGLSEHWNGKDPNGNEVAEGVYFVTVVAETDSGEAIVQQQFLHVIR